MTKLTPEQETALEAMIDAIGLQRLLFTIEEICEQKRDHIEVSYGDADLAQVWHTAGFRVHKCAVSKPVVKVSP